MTLNASLEDLAASGLNGVSPAAADVPRALQIAVKRRMGAALLRGPGASHIEPEKKRSWVAGHGWLEDDLTFEEMAAYRGPDYPDEEWARIFELIPLRSAALNRLFPALNPKHRLPASLDDGPLQPGEADAATTAIVQAIAASDYVSEVAFLELLANLVSVEVDRMLDAENGLDLAASTAMFRDALIIRLENGTRHIGHVIDPALVWRVMLAGQEGSLYRRLRSVDVPFIPSPEFMSDTIEMLRDHRTR